MKITNCTDYGALFEAIKGAEVKNVTVEGAVAGKSVAGVVAQAGAGSKIINCINKANVTGTSKAAGITVKLMAPMWSLMAVRTMARLKAIQ